MDEKIFLIIYNLPHPPFLNLFFSVVSALGSYGLIWLVFGLFLKKKARFYLGFILMTVVVFSLQNIIGRLRPYEAIQGVVYLGFIDPGGFSFPSYHATSSFFAASYISGKLKHYSKWVYILAILISTSRIYLGAHYITDILAGAIIGMVIGLGVMKYGGCKNRNSVSLF